MRFAGFLFFIVSLLRTMTVSVNAITDAECSARTFCVGQFDSSGSCGIIPSAGGYLCNFQCSRNLDSGECLPDGAQGGVAPPGCVITSNCSDSSGGTCGGTRGSCSGSCPSGQVCRAPSVLGNGDACSCHPSGGGGFQCTSWVAECRQKTTPSCDGNNVQSGSGCSGCNSNQECCETRSCSAVATPTPIPPSDPTGLSAVCDSPGVVASTIWNSDVNAEYYSLRIDGSPDSWEPGTGCDTSSTNTGLNGDVCLNLSTNYYSFSSVPGRSYHWWLHARDWQGNYIPAAGVDGGTFSCPAPSCTGVGVTGNPKISSTTTTHDVFAYGVANASTVYFPTWSDNPAGNSQDDIVWYQGIDQGGGTWKATIPLSNHVDKGQFRSDVWINHMIGPKFCGNAPFYRNNAPTFTSLVLKNDLGSIVTAETGNKNQICDADFDNSRTVLVTINAADVDGTSDITNVELRWNGVSFTRDSLTNGVANFSHTFTSGENDNSNAHNFETRITDAVGETTGWVDTGRSFKVWNCSISVAHSIFDGSAGQACNDTGFSIPAGANMGFNDLIYHNMSGGADGTGSLTWGNSYLPLVNGGTVSSPDGDLQATGRFTRLINLDSGATICPSGSQFDTGAIVDPYSLVSSGLKVDLSYIQNQENWWQGKGVAVRAGSEIASGVPVTATNPYLVMDNLTIGSSNGGVVASSSYRNTNGYNDETQYGSPHNWRINHSLIDTQKNNYQTIYDQYFAKIGVGVTGVTTIGTGSTGVLFVSGDLNIENDVVVPVNQHLMVVASGAINIGVGASRVDGIYVASGGIGATGTSDNQLIINGILYASGSSNIKLARSFTTKSDNNLDPSVVVNYRPNLIFALPGKLNKILSGWREL